MLWLDMGLGKTVVTLSAILQRMDQAQVYGTLVIAPLRVCQTVWRQEAKQWSHTQDLSFSLIHGTPAQRARAVCRRANVYLVNYENIRWLINFINDNFLSKGLYPPFNMLVSDEISKFKDHSTQRHAAIRQILPYLPYRMGLTGTPASNGYIDLFGQYMVVDSGARLGTKVTHYRDKFFNNTGYGFNKYELKPGSDAEIQQHIADITMEMSSADKLDLPKCIINDIEITLDKKTQAAYDKLEKEMFLQLEDGEQVEVFNAAALSTKCRQAANGALYLEPGSPKWSLLHDHKMDALDEVIGEAGGQPVLCLTEFKHDAERIMKKYPDAEFIGGTMSTAQVEDLVDRWTRGQIRILVGHPASMGHGLNLQYGGHIIVWFGINWSLDLYQQANARLDRQGQKNPVIIHRLVCRGTIDEAKRLAIEEKASTQSDLRKSLFNYRRTKNMS